jgi:HK97 family phage major capsid protein
MPVYAPASIHGAVGGSILGRPVVETEYSPALGTLGDILLTAPSQYKSIGKAGGIESASSIHVSFTTDETCFRFVYRIDGTPLWYTTLTGHDAVTYSPYVVLAATT